MVSRSTQPGSGFSFETLRFPLAALGIFGLLAGLGAWLVQGDFSLVPRLLVAGGVLVLLGAVAVIEARRLAALREEMVAGAVASSSPGGP